MKDKRRVCHEFPEDVRPIGFYESVLKIDVLIDFILSQTNLYVQ